MNRNENNFVPQYIKIQNYILDKIDSSEFKQGDKIPSENELAKLFSVSRITANSAIKELSTMGVVERIKGKGTFVANTDNMPTASKVFSNNIKIETMQILGNKKHFLVEAKIIKANEMLQERFQIEEHEMVYEIVRLIIHKNKPTALDYSFIPMSLLNEITFDVTMLENNYLHDYLKMYANCVPKYVRLYINTPCYDFYNISLLGIDHPDNTLIWDTNIYDNQNNLLASTTTISNNGLEKPFMTFTI